MKRIFIGAIGLILFGLSMADLCAQSSLMGSATISASSVHANSLDKVTDGDYTTQWISTNPLPSNYITRADQNLFLHQADSIGSGSGTGSFTRLTDGQMGLLGNVPLSNGKAWFALDYPNGQELALVSLKAKTNVDISIYAHHSGDSTLLGVYTNSNNYQVKRYLHTGPDIDRVSLQATGFFQVFEFSGMATPPKEYVEIDLGAVEDIGSIHGKHWPGTGSASATVIKSSIDGISWTTHTTLDGTVTDTLTTFLPNGSQARYLRLEHTMLIADYKKVYWWEVDVFSPSPGSGGSGGGGGPSSPWDSLAGVIPSYVDSAILTASSTFDQTLEDARDKDENTQWLSESPFPNNYYTRADQNNFYHLAGSNGSTSSASNFAAITDLNGGSSADVSVLGGAAWVALDFSQGETVEFINIKARADADLKIYGWQSSSDSTLLGTYSTSNNYSFQKYSMPGDSVWRISVVSTQGFDLFELAGITQNPKEWVDVDFGSAKEIGTIVTRHRSSGDHVEAIALYTSTDGQNWTHLEDLIPDALGVVSTRVDPSITAQYVRVEYTMTLQDYKKASLWEIDVYDEHGKFGEAPTAAASTVSVRELLGINTIWGWGHNQYSDLLGDGEGASLHQSHSSYARYYHNMDWDVSDPDTIVDYQAMENGQGTQALWWLDWNREYEPVVDTGLTLFNSIQFDKIDPLAWDSPYQSAYDYGYNYAAYFGSQQGNGFVDAIEIGNEPWDYEPALYRDILQGMAEGIRAADSTVQILPCALQATDPSSDLEDDNINYLGNKVLETEGSLIDGINIHQYSFATNEYGDRIGVHPEAWNSEMRGMFNAIRFRDANLPDMPIYLTEWGWDTDGGGQSCTHSECVSEAAGALYAVRGALFAHRLGMERATWYFYGNTDQGSTLWSRSGLTGSAASNFQLKKGFHALEGLVSLVGDQYFLEVINEDEDTYAYLFGDSTGQATHLITWKPIDGDDASTSTFAWTTSYHAAAAYGLSGNQATPDVLATPSNTGGVLSITVSAVPQVVVLSQNPPGQSAVQATGMGTLEEEDRGLLNTPDWSYASAEGEENPEELQATLVPNPATASSILTLGSKRASSAEVQLFNSQGSNVWSQTMTIEGESKLQIPIDALNLPVGLYYVHITTDAGWPQVLPLTVY